MARGYRIADEPTPGALATIAVQPLWPLLAIMFGGSWLSWPWFAINAFAIGSPTRGRELALAACGFVGNVAILFVIGALLVSGVVPEAGGPYLVLVTIVWKLGVSYWLYSLQSQTFDIYEYYGGPVRNGVIVLVAGYFLRSSVLGPLLESVPALRLVLA